MKKIFLIGAAPLPNEKEGIREAAGLRTEQFLSPLKKAGNEISCVLITNKPPKKKEEVINGIKSIRIYRADKNLFSEIKKYLKGFSPDIVFGINTFPAFVAAKCTPKNIPFWADLNGWIMSEVQVRSYFLENNNFFGNALMQEKTILQKADKISTVSTPQKFACMGELATIGRMRGENTHWNFLEAIPNATKFFDIDKVDTSGESLFRGKKVKNDDFVVSFIGGYNNWVDEKTLFEGVEKAMKKDKKIQFVSTGGAIKSVSNITFSNFLERIEKSEYKNRFHFLGWIETEDMAKVYHESDAGINIDFLCAETETGARNRINEMMKFSLPVITTLGSEIADDVNKYSCGIAVESGNSQAVCDAILELKNNSELKKQMGENGAKTCENIFNEDVLLKPVLEYVENLKKAPDWNLPPIKPSLLTGIISYTKEHGIKRSFQKIWQRIFS